MLLKLFVLVWGACSASATETPKFFFRSPGNGVHPGYCWDVHALVLSRPNVRKQVFAEMFRWLEGKELFSPGKG